MADAFVQKHQKTYGDLRSKIKSYDKDRDLEKLIGLRRLQLRKCEAIVKHCTRQSIKSGDDKFFRTAQAWQNTQKQVKKILEGLHADDEDDDDDDDEDEDEDEDDDDDEDPFRRESDQNPYHDLPMAYYDNADLEMNSLYREVLLLALRSNAEQSIQDIWSHKEEESKFLIALFNCLFSLSAPRKLGVHQAHLCKTCSTLEVFSPGFEYVVQCTALKQTAKCCDLCRLLLKCSQKYNLWGLGQFTIVREGSMLRVQGSETAILKVRADPGAQELYPDIQPGYPALADAGSSLHLDLISRWLRECNEEHDCMLAKQDPSDLGISRTSYPEKPAFLPRRVIDISRQKRRDSVRLYETHPGETGTYVTLSHRWGDPLLHEKFCTYKCNLNDRLTGFSFKELPKSFQDAITITRALGIQYLWIDSICIIQPHTGHWDTGLEDWDIEAKKMESYYSAAYCTIAATSAEGSSDGFLRPRKAVDFVKIPGKPDSPLYIYENIDNFQHDVIEGNLNGRGWVFQERALSRRIIHFTSTQTYWECGTSIRCESLAQMDNPRARMMSDPHFPSFLKNRPGKSQVQLFQDLYTKYTTLDLTAPSDRSVAILGLEKRLSDVFESEAQYGIFSGYLHRSLTWRGAQDKLSRIDYPSSRCVPSWSWMARYGQINYIDIPFGEVRWDFSLQCDFAKRELRGFRAKLQRNETGDNDELIFDDPGEKSNLLQVDCIVLGERYVPELPGPPTIQPQDHRPLFYVLLISPVSSDGGQVLYARVGIGLVGEMPRKVGRRPVRIV